MNEPMFDPRKAASIIKQHLIETLHDVQEQIIRLERFGADVVIYPQLGRLGSTRKLDEMKAHHDELVAQIRALQTALDKASEIDIAAFVAGIVRDRKKK